VYTEEPVFLAPILAQRRFGGSTPVGSRKPKGHTRVDFFALIRPICVLYFTSPLSLHLLPYAVTAAYLSETL
jgi:hypothetical protein